ISRNLQRLYDQLDESQRLCGEIICEMIQKNWTYGKVKDVIGEEPTPEFDDKLFLKYGCKIVQGTLTETQQQLELGQLLQLGEIMRNETNPIIVQRIIDSMYISNKDELKEQLMQAQQAQQEQQNQMAQLQMQQLQVDNQTKLSYAQAQESMAAERIAKMQTDQAMNVERLTRSEEEKTAAV